MKEEKALVPKLFTNITNVKSDMRPVNRKGSKCQDFCHFQLLPLKYLKCYLHPDDLRIEMFLMENASLQASHVGLVRSNVVSDISWKSWITQRIKCQL